ncbi:iron reductase [Mycolicibacterium sp. Dal123E01]|uniref:iron reductase n=1 Tax=Mycolicibacterium sp. Dal123E01 TaxID=3457578 RepID=UPI00403E447F
MTTAVADPLIDGMTIRRMLPLHESCNRLRQLAPDSPRVHGVAVMGDVSRRRWWALDSVTTSGRLAEMFEAAVADLGDRRAVAQQLAATFTHAVLGRAVTLFVLEGRVWDTGPGNLWMHVDSEGTIDWTAVVDPTLRVLADDSAMTDVVRLPNEPALATWTAHRCHRSLEPIFDCLHELSRGSVTRAAMWQMVGSAVIITATQVPVLTGSGEMTCMRRGQAVLDALIGFGLPVRALRRTG